MLRLTDAQHRHLRKVLRRAPDSIVWYTDGTGVIGSGSLMDSGVARGAEDAAHRTTAVRIAVAPPRSNDRLRFVVEKLQELGVGELIWLDTEFGQAKAPTAEKSRSWAVSALEQSRGGWLMTISGPMPIDLIERPSFAELSGEVSIDASTTLCIGPEGGWAPGELRSSAPLVSLGTTVLRTETAAIVGADRLIVGGLVDSD